MGKYLIVCESGNNGRSSARTDDIKGRVGVFIDGRYDGTQGRIRCNSIGLPDDVPLAQRSASRTHLNHGTVPVAIGTWLALWSDPVLETDKEAAPELRDIVWIGQYLGSRSSGSGRYERVMKGRSR